MFQLESVNQISTNFQAFNVLNSREMKRLGAVLLYYMSFSRFVAQYFAFVIETNLIAL